MKWKLSYLAKYAARLSCWKYCALHFLPPLTLVVDVVVDDTQPKRGGSSWLWVPLLLLLLVVVLLLLLLQLVACPARLRFFGRRFFFFGFSTAGVGEEAFVVVAVELLAVAVAVAIADAVAVIVVVFVYISEESIFCRELSSLCWGCFSSGCDSLKSKLFN